MNRAKLVKLDATSKADRKEKRKMTLEECSKILSEEEGVAYTPEEVQSIRDYVYVLSEIIIQHYQREKQKQELSTTATIINLELYERETNSHIVHPGLNRRAS